MLTFVLVTLSLCDLEGDDFRFIPAAPSDGAVLGAFTFTTPFLDFLDGTFGFITVAAVAPAVAPIFLLLDEVFRVFILFPAAAPAPAAVLDAGFIFSTTAGAIVGGSLSSSARRLIQTLQM